MRGCGGGSPAASPRRRIDLTAIEIVMPGLDLGIQARESLSGAKLGGDRDLMFRQEPAERTWDVLIFTSTDTDSCHGLPGQARQ